jgi:hypothetical protein
MDLIYSQQNNKTMLQIESKDNTNAIEQEIQKFKEDYGALQISGVLDRDGYKLVQEAAKVVRARRLELQNEAKDIDKKIAQIKKDFNANAKLIIDGLDHLEIELRQKLKSIDDEKERIKQAEKAARLQKFVTRTQQLFDTGFLFNGSVYTLGTIMVTTDAIHELEEEAFAAIAEQGVAMKAEIDAKEAQRKELEAKFEALQQNGKLNGIRPKEKMIVDEHGPVDPESNFWNGREEYRPIEKWEEVADKLSKEIPFDTIPTFNGIHPIMPIHDRLPTPKPSLPSFPVGYTLGFDAARNKVLQILDSTEKMTREELKTKIREIEY